MRVRAENPWELGASPVADKRAGLYPTRYGSRERLGLRLDKKVMHTSSLDLSLVRVGTEGDHGMTLVLSEVLPCGARRHFRFGVV
jgi:hypothetical protein